jgi:hypothetical protein
MTLQDGTLRNNMHGDALASHATYVTGANQRPFLQQVAWRTCTLGLDSNAV